MKKRIVTVYYPDTTIDESHLVRLMRGEVKPTSDFVKRAYVPVLVFPSDAESDRAAAEQTFRLLNTPEGNPSIATVGAVANAGATCHTSMSVGDVVSIFDPETRETGWYVTARIGFEPIADLAVVVN